jgi:phosphoadenosine phosphosulfate reductase
LKELAPREFVKEYSIKSLVSCFSGGKDSLVTTHYVMSELEDFDIDKHVVYADTGCMLPSTEPFVVDICKQFGWKLTIVRGFFFEKAKKNGMPRMKHRWCCKACKVNPMQEFIKTLKPQRAEVTGLRRDESLARSKLPQILYKRKVPSWGYCPIIAWTEKDVKAYMKKHDLPTPPHYRLGLKETCMCGVFSTPKQMLILKAQFPELWQRFVDLEAGFRTKGAAFYFNYKPVFAKDLAKQKTLDCGEVSESVASEQCC